MTVSKPYTREDGSCAQDITFRISDEDGNPLPREEALALTVPLRYSGHSRGQLYNGEDGYIYATFWAYGLPKEE